MTICQSCKKNRANTHIKKIVNGETTELMLCEECASRLGYSNIFNDWGFDFDNFLGGFFSNTQPSHLESESKHCEKCGSSFLDISNTGKVGCAKCYDTFFDQLMPNIKRIHGNTKHFGKKAFLTDEKNILENKIKSLNDKMQVAIKEQNFEEAAKLRDEIKVLKEGNRN